MQAEDDEEGDLFGGEAEHEIQALAGELPDEEGQIQKAASGDLVNAKTSDPWGVKSAKLLLWTCVQVNLCVGGREGVAPTVGIQGHQEKNVLWVLGLIQSVQDRFSHPVCV